MKKILYAISFILVSNAATSQVKIGSDAKAATSSTVKPYTVLAVSSDSKQGVQPPVVVLTDISSKTTPVKNPVDGMLVYNYGSTSVQQGLYVWNAHGNSGNGLWEQLADSSNIISSMTMKNKSAFSLLGGTPIGQYVSLYNAKSNYDVYTDLIGAEMVDGGVKLLRNSGYRVSIAMNIKVNNAAYTTTGGIGGKKVYLHKYKMVLRDANGKEYGDPVGLSIISAAGVNDNTHSFYTSFAFPLTLTDVTLFPYIAYEGTEENGQLVNDGSYYTNFPSSGAGEVTIQNVQIQIERGILAL